MDFQVRCGTFKQTPHPWITLLRNKYRAGIPLLSQRYTFPEREDLCTDKGLININNFTFEFYQTIPSNLNTSKPLIRFTLIKILRIDFPSQKSLPNRLKLLVKFYHVTVKEVKRWTLMKVPSTSAYSHAHEIYHLNYKKWRKKETRSLRYDPAKCR